MFAVTRPKPSAPNPSLSLDASARRPRIGVVHRGVIVAERTLDRRTDVSVGCRIDATVHIDRDDVPDKLEVLRLVNGRYHVVLPADPTARLTLRGAPIAGVTVQDGGRKLVPVEQSAGGSLVVGDTVIMFQLVRGGSEHVAVREETVLRIGLVFEGRLISDQVFSDTKAVCVGRGRRDRVVLDSDYEGPSLCFRRHRDGSATLDADEGAALRIALPDAGPQDVDTLLSRGQARRRRGRLEVMLTVGARGRAQLGPYTVLYQVLRQRAVVPVMQRHGLVRGTVQTVMQDPVWSASLAMAALLVCGVLSQALVFHDRVGKFQTAMANPEEVDRDHVIEVAVAQLEPPTPPTAPELKPQEPKTPAAADKDVKKDKPKERSKPKKVREDKRSKPASTATRDVDPADHARQVRRRVATRTIAGGLMGKHGGPMVLASDDADADSTVFAGKPGRPGQDGTGPDGGGLALKGAVGGGTVGKVRRGKAKTFKRVAGEGIRVKVKKREKKVTIELAPPTGGDASSAPSVGRVIARKRRAVQRCYERSLRSNTALSAKLRVSFTVGTAGTVTRTTVSGVAGDLAACVRSVFMRIRGLPLLSRPTVFKQVFILTSK